ncbi:hypothetical protein DFAR_420007 [Desulfarculales bacterium]
MNVCLHNPHDLLFCWGHRPKKCLIPLPFGKIVAIFCQKKPSSEQGQEGKHHDRGNRERQ